MSLNPQATGNDLYDVLEGSVSSYFTQIGSVLQQNECVNGQYRTTTSGSYANACPAAMPAFTRVCISTNGSTIVDMDTSYITVQLQYTLSLDKGLTVIPATVTDTVGLGKYFIGFKNSIEALERYSIFVNSQELYTQLHVGPESAIFTAGLNDMVKGTAPYVFTPSKNALEGSPNVCGAYVEFPKGYTLNTPFTISFPVKINLNQFLPIASMKYLPSWMGRWDIELHFHWRNLVIIPVAPEFYLPTVDPKYSYYALHSPNYHQPYLYSSQFTQIGCKFKTPDTITITAAANPSGFAIAAVADQALRCSAGKITDCMFNQVTFQIQMAVNDALRA
jgi:hypothetical protein